jgi:tryptophan-rich sensory protein
MGIALYLIWRAGASGQHNRQTLIWFTIQLVLNALWSFLFFGFQRLGLALVEIVLMWIAIVITIRAAFPLSRWAAVLLLPYLAWVTFATLLNASLWWLNRGQ